MNIVVYPVFHKAKYAELPQYQYSILLCQSSKIEKIQNLKREKASVSHDSLRLVINVTSVACVIEARETRQ